MKENFKDMLLESESGYMMPFALEEKEELPTTLGYGKQRHPMTGEEFNHLGVDFAIKNRDLYAVASGMIVGAGNDALHDNYIVAKYGKYEVTYGHLAEAYTGYGESVSAGDKIAKSGDFLHVGIRFNGQDIDPMVFLSMIWANIQQLAAMGIQKQPTEESLGTKNIKNSFDKDYVSILMLMLRWLPSYMNDLRNRAYNPPPRAEASLRNIFAQAASKNYFFESIPSVANPLGLSERSVPLAEKIRDILIHDFLSYLALNHNIYPETWDENEKKKLLSQASEDGLTADPLKDLEIDIQSYDVERTASVYYDNQGIRCWTKAWFNGREKGENAIEITRQLAMKFFNDEMSMDEWLSRFYPKQMTVYHKAISLARSQLLGM